MTDWGLIAARLALYGDLGLLFGIPVFALQGRTALTPRRMAGLCAGLAAGGLLLSPLGFALVAAQMSGTPLGQLDRALVWTLFGQTVVGAALAMRMAALLFALIVALFLPSTRRMSWLLVASGGIALATLAWSGHAAAGEGAAGRVRLAADIVHLLAASAWLGGLAMLLMLVSPRKPATQRSLNDARAALAGFAVTGTVIVVLLAATGIANIAFIVGLQGVTTLPSSSYGRLLLLKLLAFAAMLSCAALNRFVLTPRLPHQGASALPALRWSIALESLFALLVLALVAWLGTLEPG